MIPVVRPILLYIFIAWSHFIKIGIVGAGKVGRTLGQRWSELGHYVYYGVLNPADSKHQVLMGHARLLSSLEAVSEMLVLSVHCPAVEADLTEIKDVLP